MLEATRPTELLYLSHPSGDPRGEPVVQFEATVLAVNREACTLVLDRTGFFPAGGHQHADQGRIERDRGNYAVITDVRKDDEGLVHHTYAVLRGDLEPGQRVVGEIEMTRRQHLSRLHTAQHVLSRVALDRFGVETGRADFSPAGGLAVLERALTWEELVLLEDDVNRIVRKGRRVERRLDGAQSTIAIEGLDANPCCGTHVANTSEIGAFKFTRVEDRVLRYEVGEAARRIATRQANHALRAADRLGLADSRELSGAIEELVRGREEAERRLDEWRVLATEREVAKARGTACALPGTTTRLHLVDLAHLEASEARTLLKDELTGEDELWLGLTGKRGVLISSSTAEPSARDIAAAFCERWSVRGGGNPWFAQAGPVPEEVVRPLEQIAAWLLARGDD